MRKNTIHYLIDGCALVAMLVMTATGLLMKFTLPPGSGGKVVWGLGRHDWGEVHFWAAVALVTLITLHLMLHWAWVCASTRRIAAPHAKRPPDRRRDRAYGAVFFAAIAILLTGFVFYTRASITAAPAGGKEAGHAEQTEHAEQAEHAGSGVAAPVETPH